MLFVFLASWAVTESVKKNSNRYSCLGSINIQKGPPWLRSLVSFERPLLSQEGIRRYMWRAQEQRGDFVRVTKWPRDCTGTGCLISEPKLPFLFVSYLAISTIVTTTCFIISKTRKTFWSHVSLEALKNDAPARENPGQVEWVPSVRDCLCLHGGCWFSTTPCKQRGTDNKNTR